MPRKPKQDKVIINVVVNGTPIAAVLHPPTRTRKSWFVYWSGLKTSKSTGQRKLEEAITVVENMLKNGGRRPSFEDTVLSDEEFEQIQRRHFAKKTDPIARKRSEKTLEDTLDSINAFREVTKIYPITLATPDDCERFQQTALGLLKNWRRKYPKKKATDEYLSPNSVLKWSRALQAAFERACKTAGKKCVRGVVPEGRLLTSNPWRQFTWIEGIKRPIRQFDNDELLSFLDFLESTWDEVPVGGLAAKVFLWSSCRKLEIASLQWTSLKTIGNEVHFEIIGKWGVEKWFRIPPTLHEQLESIRTDSPYVFAAYSDQILKCHKDRPGMLRKIKAEYNERNFADWFYRRVIEWSSPHPKGRAFVHVFRKTSLQHARRGEDINRQVAQDARVSEGVMMTNYVKETDEEMRQRSNRTYYRILASLSPEVARRYGHVEVVLSVLEHQLQAAVAAKNWKLASELTAKLDAEQRRTCG